MRQTRSSLILQAAEAENAAKMTRSAAIAAKPKQSSANATTVTQDEASKKRKCQSLPASKPPPATESDDEDVQSVHSVEFGEEPVHFAIKCLKCDARFSRRSYLFMHFKLAHNIDLNHITPDKSPKKKETRDTDEPRSKKGKLEFAKKQDTVKIEDEDYFSCSSSYSSEIIFLDKDPGCDSDVDVESNFDENPTCHQCNKTLEYDNVLNSYVNHKCLMRKLSGDHDDIIQNQPFVNLQRLKGASRKRRHQTSNLPHTCPLCGVKFATNIDMKIHAQMEHRVDPNLMKFAKGNGNDDKKFLTASRKHRDCDKKSKNDLAQNGSGKIVCQSCSKTFGSISKLDQHIDKKHPNLIKIKKYDHNADPLAKALTKKLRLSKQEPKTRVKSLFQSMGLQLQFDPAKWI